MCSSSINLLHLNCKATNLQQSLFWFFFDEFLRESKKETITFDDFLNYFHHQENSEKTNTMIDDVIRSTFLSFDKSIQSDIENRLKDSTKN